MLRGELLAVLVLLSMSSIALAIIASLASVGARSKDHGYAALMLGLVALIINLALARLL